MSEKIGNVSFHDPQNEYGFQKPYSDETARMIDEEVRLIINTAYDRTKTLLRDKRKELEALAQELLKKEVLFQNDLERLIGRRPWEIKGHLHEDKKIEPAPEETKPEAAPSQPKPSPGIDWKPNLQPPLA
jgi:cell division protease FtsH